MSNSFNPIFATEQASQIQANSYELGENGAVQLSDYGMCTREVTPQYVGALVALNNKLTRGNTVKTPVRKGVASHHSDYSIGCDYSQIKQLYHSVINAAQLQTESTRNKIYLDLIIMFFNLRDIRGDYGKGEKTLSYWIFMHLYKTMPNTIRKMIHLIPHYGSWDDLNHLYEMAHCNPGINSLSREEATALKNTIAEIYAIQLMKDDNVISSGDKTNKISLAIKWAPREGKSLDKATKMAKAIVKCMYPNQFELDFKTAMKSYRSLMSTGNRLLKTSESLMASGQFSKLDFNSMPGRCMAKRTKAWQNVNKSGGIRSGLTDRIQCSHNYSSYLNKLAEGTSVAKGKSLFIHEIADKLYNVLLSPEDSVLYESMFDAHVNAIKESAIENNTSLGNTVVIADVSGSMDGDPMSVAVALALVASAPGIASPAWTNIVMTFHNNPSWVKLVYPSNEREYMASKSSSTGQSVYSRLGPFNPTRAGQQLTWREKVLVVRSMDWGMSTDFVKALDLVASRAISAGVKMPHVMCISDMQWNQASRTTNAYSSASGPLSNLPYRHSGSPTTLMRDVKTALRATSAGDDFTMILWNVRGGLSGSPCGADQCGFTEVSGFSTNTLRLFLTEGTLEAPGANKSTATSWDTLRLALDHSDYDMVRDIAYMMRPWRATDMPLSTKDKEAMWPKYTRPNDIVNSSVDSPDSGGSAAFCPPKTPPPPPSATPLRRQSAYSSSPMPFSPKRSTDSSLFSNLAWPNTNKMEYTNDIANTSTVDYAKMTPSTYNKHSTFTGTPTVTPAVTPAVTPTTSPRDSVSSIHELSSRIDGLEQLHVNSVASTTQMKNEISEIKSLLTALVNR